MALDETLRSRCRMRETAGVDANASRSSTARRVGSTVRSQRVQARSTRG